MVEHDQEVVLRPDGLLVVDILNTISAHVPVSAKETRSLISEARRKLPQAILSREIWESATSTPCVTLQNIESLIHFIASRFNVVLNPA